MIPVTYKMIDLNGLDLAEINGGEVPGIYNKIVSAYNTSRFAIMCNWFFAGIIISPSHVLISQTTGGFLLNDLIFVKSDDTVEVLGLAPEPVIEELEVTENGTYNAPEGVDGYSPVTVNVPIPLPSWPSVSEAVEDSTCAVSLVKTVPYAVPYVSTQIQTFYDTYARTPKPVGMTSEHIYVAEDIHKTISELGLTFSGELEYYGNVYGNSGLISACDLVLLGDFANNTSTGPFTLLDSVYNYSGVVLNGIYMKNRTSQYNTSMLYLPISLGIEYWTGMKDRNHTYDCFVTFNTGTQVTLRGNNQVIIYGIP